MRQARPTTERYHRAARRKRCRGRTLVKEGNDQRKDHGIPSVSGRDQILFLVRVCKTSRTDQGDPELGPLSRRTKFQIAGTLRRCRTTSESLTVIFAGDVKQSNGSRLGSTSGSVRKKEIGRLPLMPRRRAVAKKLCLQAAQKDSEARRAYARSRIENGGSRIAIFHSLSSILNITMSLFQQPARTAPPPPPRQSPRRRRSRARYRPYEFGLAVWLRRAQQGPMRRTCYRTSRRSLRP